jgi:signal transduction histidine kinase
MGTPAAAASAETATSSSPRREELVKRAASIASGSRRRRDDLGLPRELSRRIDDAERRAIGLTQAAGGCPEGRRIGALEFVADAIAMLMLERRTEPGDVRAFVSDAAAAIGVSPGAAALDVYMRALASRDAAQLPPHLAVDFFVDLVVELGPAEAVSLWTLDSPARRLECLASSGGAATSRRVRAAARSLLEGGFDVCDDSSHIRAVTVARWDRPFAALVGRGRPETSARLAMYLSAAASALSPLVERELLFERSAARERVLVSATERKLLRLGCDLHDGPLQEIVAFADDLRLARDQVVSLVDAAESVRVRGRFDDLEARLASLDEGLRDISHAVRSTSAIEQPLEHVLRKEVDALSRATGIETELAVDGNVSTLTESQKIVLFRVVQESLSNARKHSNATRVRVRLRSATAYVSVTVSDDGCGFDVERSPRSCERLGLVGVIERVRLLGGDVEIASAPGEGVLLRATLPRWRPVKKLTTSVYAVT